MISTPSGRRLAGVVLVLFAAGTGAASAQSLGEIARQEEARRKAIKASGKIYTNENIRAEPAPAQPAGATQPPPAAAPATGTVAPPSPSGVQPPSPSGTPPAGGAAADAGAEAAKPETTKNDEAAWRQRIQAARDALQRAQTFAEALQSRINALSADFTARDDPAQRAVIGNDRQKALAELDRVKQEIEQYTKAIAAIQEEARRAGIPPGWLR